MTSDCAIRLQIVIPLTLVWVVCHSAVPKLGAKLPRRFHGELSIQRGTQRSRAEVASSQHQQCDNRRKAHASRPSIYTRLSTNILKNQRRPNEKHNYIVHTSDDCLGCRGGSAEYSRKRPFHEQVRHVSWTRWLRANNHGEEPQNSRLSFRRRPKAIGRRFENGDRKRQGQDASL